jgi:hypothetical protein
MSELRFPRWLAAIGVFGGVSIALILPVVVLMLGDDFTSGVKLVIIILAMLVGAVLAGISAVVGITIPTAVSGMALKIGRDDVNLCCDIAHDCCPPSATSSPEDAGTTQQPTT